MDIFEWVKDIEQLYEKLIDKAKNENLDELASLRKNQEESIEDLLSKKQKIVNLALKNLSVEIKSGLENFDDKLAKALTNIEKNYKENKAKIKKSILEKIGFDF